MSFKRRFSGDDTIDYTLMLLPVPPSEDGEEIDVTVSYHWYIGKHSTARDEGPDDDDLEVTGVVDADGKERDESEFTANSWSNMIDSLGEHYNDSNSIQAQEDGYADYMMDQMKDREMDERENKYKYLL